MKFISNAGIKDGAYGTYAKRKNKDTGETEYEFVPLGNAVYVDEILENIENNSISLLLAYNYMNKEKTVIVPRAELFNKTKVDALANKGIDIPSTHYNTFLDTIRLQEQDLCDNNVNPTLIYNNLGWLYYPIYDKNGIIKSHVPCYRTTEFLNGPTGRYEGNFKITPMGTFEKWRQMVIDEVVGHTVIEFALISSLSAIIVGSLAMDKSIENPIVHFYYLSSSGKSTAAYLAASIMGQPFSGEINTYDPILKAYKKQKSILQTWGSTSNAIILSQSGNRGVPTILDEFGKFTGKNPRDLIFNFSEGSDKMRANQDLKVRVSEGYNTTFLSFGESSLLEKCTDKLEGLNVRVMEVNKPLTDSPEHSRRIKSIVKDNNGWAAPMLAEYIIKNGGINSVVKTYDNCIKRLSEILPNTEFSDRISEKFYAIFMTTAIISSKALNIDFDIKGLLNFFRQHEEENSDSRNMAETCYNEIIEYFNIHLGNFYVGDKEPRIECWGRYNDKPFVWKDEKVVVAEYSVRPAIVEEFFRNNGYKNMKNCINEWKSKDYLNPETEKDKRRRVIIPKQTDKEYVYVFQVFADEETAKAIKDNLTKKNEKVKLFRTNRDILLDDNEEGGENDGIVVNAV